MYGDTKEEAEWSGGRYYTKEEQDFFREKFEGDMFGFTKNKEGRQFFYGQHFESASNPKDKKNFDTSSPFNQVKFNKKKPKVEKVYQKYEPKADSNFHQDNRGFKARPNLFQTKWTAYFNTRIHNPFRIRDYKTFDKAPNKAFDQSFESAKKWFDSQTHESMTRDTMQNKDFFKILPIKQVALLLTFLFGTKKAAYAIVK